MNILKRKYSIVRKVKYDSLNELEQTIRKYINYYNTEGQIKRTYSNRTSE
ncbi:MAG: IS3 family transposase [Turicibacter bilis]